MSTMRSTVSKMLLSTNPSRIVDITNEKELKEGRKTNGEPSDYQDPDKGITQSMKEGAKDLKEKVKEGMKNMGDSLNEMTDRATRNAQSMSNEAKDATSDMADKASRKLQNMSEKADNKMEEVKDRGIRMADGAANAAQDRSDDGSTRITDMEQKDADQMQQMADQAGGILKDRHRGKGLDAGNETAASLQEAEEKYNEMDKRDRESMDKSGNRVTDAANDAAKRMGKLSNGETPIDNLNRATGNLDKNVEDSYDIPKKVKKEYKVSPQDEQADSQRAQPGTKWLRGTDDNFDDDPAVSIDMMQDKIREMKNKITGGKDHPVTKTSKALKGTTQNIKETVKGTVLSPLTKAKEFLTGEKESEKPDMNQAEVKTREGTFPPGTQVDLKGKPKKNKKGSDLPI